MTNTRTAIKRSKAEVGRVLHTSDRKSNAVIVLMPKRVNIIK